MRRLWRSAACAAFICVVSGGAWGVESDALADVLSKPVLPKGCEQLTFLTVLQKLHALDVRADRQWEDLPSAEAYARRQAALRARMKAALGDWLERTPLNVRTVATVDCDGFSVEKLFFESMPGNFVTANLFIPDAAKTGARLPVVVMSCGHSELGKDAEMYLHACTVAAQRGLVALMFDPYEQGERIELKGLRPTLRHNILGGKSALVGWPLAMLRIWDGIRAIDCVQARPEVDPSRIGYMGQSGGGTMTALMMAFDPRIKVAAPSCFLTSLRSLCATLGPQDAEQNVFGQLTFGLNHTGYVLMSDAAAAVTCRFADGFPICGTRDLFDVVGRVSERLGRRNRCTFNSAAGLHGWTESTIQASVDWVRGWLVDGHAPQVDESRYRALDFGFDKKRMAVGLRKTARGVFAADGSNVPAGRLLMHDRLAARMHSFENARKSISDKERRRMAVRLSGVRRPEETGVTVQEGMSCVTQGVRVTRCQFLYPDGLALPACRLAPESSDGKGATVLLVAHQGRKSQAKQVTKLLAEGKSVIVADLTGCGEIGKPGAIYYQAAECPEEGVSVMLNLMGETMVGRRATDILVIAKWIFEMTGVRPELKAVGRLSIPAAHAAAADRAAFASVSVDPEEKPWSWYFGEGGEKPCRFTNSVPDALKWYDWPDLLRD